jgi:hypothetical protein
MMAFLIILLSLSIAFTAYFIADWISSVDDIDDEKNESIFDNENKKMKDQ